jgi:hypothetical protein
MNIHANDINTGASVVLCDPEMGQSVMTLKYDTEPIYLSSHHTVKGAQMGRE